MTKDNSIQSQHTDIKEILSISREINELSNELHTDTVTHLIYTVEVINEYIRRKIAKDKATFAKFRILNTLVLNGGSMRVTDLSIKTFRTKSTLTRAINNMIRDGTVIKDISNKDRREKVVSITKKGVELLQKTIEKRRSMSNEIMSVLSKKQMLELNNMARRIRRHVRNKIE